MLWARFKAIIHSFGELSGEEGEPAMHIRNRPKKKKKGKKENRRKEKKNCHSQIDVSERDQPSSKAYRL